MRSWLGTAAGVACIPTSANASKGSTASAFRERTGVGAFVICVSLVALPRSRDARPGAAIAGGVVRFDGVKVGLRLLRVRIAEGRRRRAAHLRPRHRGAR